MKKTADGRAGKKGRWSFKIKYVVRGGMPSVRARRNTAGGVEMVLSMIVHAHSATEQSRFSSDPAAPCPFSAAFRDTKTTMPLANRAASMTICALSESI